MFHRFESMIKQESQDVDNDIDVIYISYSGPFHIYIIKSALSLSLSEAPFPLREINYYSHCAGNIHMMYSQSNQLLVFGFR